MQAPWVGDGRPPTAHGRAVRGLISSPHPTDGPGWGFGKFVCHGRFWAAAQIKLVVMTLLLHYDINHSEGQTDRPEDIMMGEKRTPSRTQQMMLKRLDPTPSL